MAKKEQRSHQIADGWTSKGDTTTWSPSIDANTLYEFIMHWPFLILSAPGKVASDSCHIPDGARAGLGPPLATSISFPVHADTRWQVS